jgi:hypothetical protein
MPIDYTTSLEEAGKSFFADSVLRCLNHVVVWESWQELSSVVWLQET